MATNHGKLPKHIAQMVQKNNLVMAIKTLAQEQDISMTEAKQRIDDYELKIKETQDKKIQKIAKKQGTTQPHDSDKITNPVITYDIGDGRICQTSIDPSTQADNAIHSSKFDNINAGLDQHLADIGYKKPLVPYWVKRVLIIIVVIAILAMLSRLIWR